ncbi:hypothetical protein A3J41_00345 [candidate division TM6 bacterium RIFCSPHIGHO2_12_FULL_38_8]|nr:MAG: hypothetical protein A3J41_00345 [candidate division TM6 bacterium RIFCSPHIGHO2_12_FULL_38_8]
MLAKVRKFVHGTIYKVFLWIFMIAFLSGGLAIVNFGEEKNWVIKVFKQTLTYPKFQVTLKRVQQQQAMYRQKGFAFAHQNAAQEAAQISVSGLLAQHVMQSLGFCVAPDYVNARFEQELQQLPPYFFKSDGSLDQETFLKAIAPETMQDIVTSIEIEVKNKLLFGLVDAAVYVPEFEMMLQYNAEFANKKYSYLSLPLSKYLAQVRETIPADEVLSKFYKKTSIADQFRTVERRSGTMWKFLASNFVAPVSDADVKQFYDRNKAQRYVIEQAQMRVRSLLIDPKLSNDMDAKTKIQDLSAKVQKDPDQFEELISKFSDDKKAAARGGLSEFFTRNDKDIDSVIAETAFEYLGSDWQISAPLKTARGYELIQRITKLPAKYKDFKLVEAEIKKELVAEKFKKRFMQDASRVATGAKYQPESLKKFIERYKGVKSELSLDARKAGIEYTHLFKLEQGSYAAFFDKDQGVILLCSEIEKSKLPEFAQVKSKVLNLYHQDQALAKLQEQLALAYQDAAKMPLVDVAKKYGVAVQQAKFENVAGKIEQSAILKEAEMASMIKGMQHVGAIGKVVNKSDGILIKLEEVEPLNVSVFQEQKEQLGQAMFYMKLYQIKDGFIASLYRTATLNNKIEIKNELLQINKEV